MKSDNSNVVLGRKPRILLGITGSVAAVKGPEIAVKMTRDLGMNVRVLLTKGGENFWTKANLYDPQHWDELQRRIVVGKDHNNNNTNTSNNIDGDDKLSTNNNDDNDGETRNIIVHYADDEWKEWEQLGDPVLHIDLRDWADLLVIAPLSAHTLAKISNGLCDDTLSCLVRAWDYGHHPTRPGKPIVLAPAMNTAMWDHPLTLQQLDIIRNFWKKNNDSGDASRKRKNGMHVVEPEEKILACGEVGNGALASVDNILRVIKNILVVDK